MVKRCLVYPVRCIISGYMILDGFDLGVGILHPFIAKTDEERRIDLNSIGPIWDGNEVWLILGGGALFAAFPFSVCLALFSGAYTAMMLVLLAFILRTVAIEFRSKREAYLADSVGLGVLHRLVPHRPAAWRRLRQCHAGLPIDENGNMWATLFDMLTPFTLLLGVTTVFMVATHGAMFLIMKTEGEQQDRLRRLAPILMIIFFVLNTIIVLMIAFTHEDILSNYLTRIWPIIFPAGALAAVLVSYYFLRQEKYFPAFIASGAMIALLIFAAAAGMYPNLLFSTIDPAYNLTIFNSASAPNTLVVMLVIALIGMPFVLLYTAGVYYFFRGKVQLDPTSY
ncbi:MAG: cytochrome d ubiquinol oxidase subunit II [Chloroflexota bacterium]